MGWRAEVEWLMYRKILLAYDGTIEGRQALLEGAEVTQQFHAETWLLAVIPPLPNYPMAELIPQDFLTEETQRIRKTLDEGVERLLARGLKAAGILAYGEPVSQIHAYARQLEVDLVVVGHRRHGRLARWWRGAVGTTLLTDAPCSILIAIAKDSVPLEA